MTVDVISAEVGTAEVAIGGKSERADDALSVGGAADAAAVDFDRRGFFACSSPPDFMAGGDEVESSEYKERSSDLKELVRDIVLDASTSLAGSSYFFRCVHPPFVVPSSKHGVLHPRFNGDSMQGNT